MIQPRWGQSSVNQIRQDRLDADTAVSRIPNYMAPSLFVCPTHPPAARGGRFYQKKTENFSEFFAKRGGSGPIQNFLNRKILGIQIDGGGGVSLVRGNSKKKQFFLHLP